MPKIFFYLIFISLTLSACVKTCGNADQTANISDDKTLNLFIWGEYTSPEILNEFETATGIRVIESNFASNEELLAKIQAGADGYDLIIPSDYMVTVMRQLDLLAPLDKTKIPNAANIDPGLLGKSFDPENIWTLPYSWSVTGIVYNKARVIKPVAGYKDLFTRDDLNHRTSVLDDNREGIAGILKWHGFSVNTIDTPELAIAKASMIKVKSRVREFNSSPSSLLRQGDFLASQIFSNEALRLTASDNKFEFILPEEGFTVAIDNMAIPKNSLRKSNAMALINFLLRPDINLRFSTELLAAPVISGVADKLPPDMREHPALRGLKNIEAHAEMIQDLGQNTKLYDQLWTEVKASDL